MDKKQLRSSIFRHLDGIVTAPIISALAEKNILEYILTQKEFNLSEISQKFSANEGYLNVALRVLASQNYLNYQVDNVRDSIQISINENSVKVFSFQNIYQDLNEFLSDEDLIKSREISEQLCRKRNISLDEYKSSLMEKADENSLEFQLKKHIEGIIIGPIIVKLGMSRMFHKYLIEASFSAGEFHKKPDCF